MSTTENSASLFTSVWGSARTREMHRQVHKSCTYCLEGRRTKGSQSRTNQEGWWDSQKCKEPGRFFTLCFCPWSLMSVFSLLQRFLFPISPHSPPSFFLDEQMALLRAPYFLPVHHSYQITLTRFYKGFSSVLTCLFLSLSPFSPVFLSFLWHLLILLSI